MRQLLSERISNIRSSPTFAFDAYVKLLEKKGQKIINFGLGEPDFDSPLKIKKAGIEAIKSNFSHYTAIPGISELRKKIAHKLLVENNLSYSPSQVVVGVGAKQLLYNAFQALLNNGDEVVIPTPTWSTYLEQVKLSGGKPVLVSLKSPFKLKSDDIIPFINHKTKIILINTPSNPTGAIVDQVELERIAKIAIKKNLFVISDEIYEKITYGVKNYSIASFSQKIKDRVVTINGFSKSYAMTGWRVGYAAGPKEIIDSMILIQSQTTSATSSISQKAALGAFSGSENDVMKMVKEFKKRRDYILKELSLVKLLALTPPEGAFYIFIDVRNLLNRNIKSSEEWCMNLLESEKVAVIPGEAFESPGFIRISFTTHFDDIKEGIKRIKGFIKHD